jgi:VanZ family protein
MRVTRFRPAELWLPPLLLMAAIFVVSAQPGLDSGLGWIDHVGRKLVHFGEYALLGYLGWRPLRTVMPDRRAALLAFVLATLYAASDELHQSYVNDRHGTPVDWAIDVAGAAAAAFAVTARRRVAS